MTTSHSSAAAVAEADPPAAGIGHNQPPEATIPERLADTYGEATQQADMIAARANEAPRQIIDDEWLKKAGDIGADALKLWKTIEAARNAEKAPYLAAERQVDGFFKPTLERLDRIKRAMLDRAGAYNRAKADAERRVREEEARRQREAADLARQEAEQAAAAGRMDDAMADLAGAQVAAAAASEAAAAATAPAADLTRTRSGAGTLITTRTVWAFEVTDFDAIPIDRLKPYLKREHVEQAIRLAVKQGVRDLPGVRIFQEEAAQFRG